MEAIETKKLTKSYGKVRGITELSLTVHEGEFFGFIGPNGAGKSTTIRTLLGFVNPTCGSASVLGKDIVRDKSEILRNIGYVPSDTVFYTGMKVRDILKLSSDIRRKDCSDMSDMLCERFQLDTSRRADELSFGNRKKVGIVCALQHDPKLIILDEPTSGLDPLMQREFFTILRERNKAGTTVFLSSHVLSEIQHNCTRAAIIRNGNLVTCDRVENLSKSSAKRVTIHGEFVPELLSGVRDIQTSEGIVSFLYSGDINELIRSISKVSVTDLIVSEPDLEEIFLHYYSDGGEVK